MHSLSPEELVRQADALADIERNDRTNAIIEALQEYLEERRQDEQFWEHVAEAYYEDRIEFDLVGSLAEPSRPGPFSFSKPTSNPSGWT